MLTQEQINAVCELIAEYNGGEPEEYVDEIVGTRDPVSDYLNRCGSVERDDDYGGEGYVVRGFQVAKGTARRDVYIIDFGDVRRVYVI